MNSFRSLEKMSVHILCSLHKAVQNTAENRYTTSVLPWVRSVWANCWPEMFCTFSVLFFSQCSRNHLQCASSRTGKPKPKFRVNLRRDKLRDTFRNSSQNYLQKIFKFYFKFLVSGFGCRRSWVLFSAGRTTPPAASAGCRARAPACSLVTTH